MTDKTCMRMALDLAEKGRGKTTPNPMVGAVIVKNGKIIGRGYHRGPGRDHAEVAAIKNARVSPKGSTLYVNLEPCCHTGRTGPCTEAIAAAGIAEVVVAVKDPNPTVNGRGFRRLRQLGVKVTTGTLRAEATRLNEAYLGYHIKKRPFVILKLAQTLDGRIASSSGDSKWISGPQSLKLAHRLRACSDAVLVGMGTVRADNPSLTVRHVKGRNPYRIVISRSMKFPRGTNLLEANDDRRTIIAAPADKIERFGRSRRANGAICWSVATGRDGQPDLSDFLARAYDFGLQSILVEGGAELATSFIKAGLVDKMYIITAPILLGRGIDAIGELKTKSLTEAIKFDPADFIVSGDDMVFVGYPKGIH